MVPIHIHRGSTARACGIVHEHLHAEVVMQEGTKNGDRRGSAARKRWGPPRARCWYSGVRSTRGGRACESREEAPLCQEFVKTPWSYILFTLDNFLCCFQFHLGMLPPTSLQRWFRMSSLTGVPPISVKGTNYGMNLLTLVSCFNVTETKTISLYCPVRFHIRLHERQA